MSKDTQFKPGDDPRRKGAGRPPGAKNKLLSKLEQAMKSADNSSKDAVKYLQDVINGEVKGASVSNKITCAVKILDLSFKYEDRLKEALEEGRTPVGAKVDDKPDVAPLISAMPNEVFPSTKH